MRKLRAILILVVLLGICFLFTGCSVLGNIEGDVADGAAEEDDLADAPLGGLLGTRSETVEIIVLMTMLSIAPSLLIMLSSFTRIVIVLSMVRNATGLQQMPPNQVIVGLALILTFFVMTPVINEVRDTAYTPYVENQITQTEALELGMQPLRTFMLRYARTDHMNMFIDIANRSKSGEEIIQSIEDAPNIVVISAFLTSEIQQAFQIGFFLYLPFIVVDMIVASVLMSMGMMMLPPVAIALPFKVLLFVMIDGWTLTVKTLVESFFMTF